VTTRGKLHHPLLHGHTPAVERGRVGISYSGGGPRFVLELGATRAFVKSGIVPSVIAGVSAGALTAVVHASDPVRGEGIDAAAALAVNGVSTKAFGLTPEHFLQRALRERGKLRSVGDNEVLREVVRSFSERLLGDRQPRLDRFAPPRHPRLLIAASDWISGDALWFDGDTLVEDALLASSAIPGVFPWRHHDSNDGHAVLIDGGVISNQPLSKLVLEGCGTIFACGFASHPQAAHEPANALHSVLDAIQMMMHQCSHLEEEYVRLKLDGRGEVYRLVIDIDLPANHYDFTLDQLTELVGEAEQQVTTQLAALGYSQPALPAAAGAN